MIVFTREIKWDELQSLWAEPEKSAAYVESIVPKWSLCFPNIVNNQRYYLAINIRNYLSIPYKVRTPVVNELVKGIHIEGICADFVAVDEMINECDKALLIRLLKENYGHKN